AEDLARRRVEAEAGREAGDLQLRLLDVIVAPGERGLEGPAGLAAQRLELDVSHPDVGRGTGLLGSLGGGAGRGEERGHQDDAHARIVSLRASSRPWRPPLRRR